MLHGRWPRQTGTGAATRVTPQQPRHHTLFARMESEIIARLCGMPLVLRQAGYGAMIRSVKAAGYRSGVTPITEAEISAFLREHPELVTAWYNYSGDQRSTPNWSFEGPNDGDQRGWRVAWVPRRRRPPNRRRQPATRAPSICLEKKFPDQFDACAYFIARKAEDFFDGWLARRRHRKDALARLTE